MEEREYSNNYPFANIALPYSFNALEPYIDTKTMELHHNAHLQTYVDNLNKALKSYPAYHNWSLEKLIIENDSLPDEIRVPVAQNAGGVYNHIFYFFELSPKGENKMSNFFLSALIKDFGSVEDFKSKLKQTALAVFGSGYAWLVLNKSCRFEIVQSANQETPLPSGYCPVLNIDVWEHAYYLKNYNKRAEYFDNWFNVLNWKEIENRYNYCREQFKCMNYI